MNRLSATTSPYLRQHADNPVHWRPWDPEALDEARDQNKPIFLSIGYSACHWCHVMAHESFEDDGIAERINQDFIPIKVDREERPDLDQIYQGAHQLLNRSGGGWPLSIFLTPDLQPFYSGTYFPPEPRFGMPSFVQILDGVNRAWLERPADVAAQSASVTEALGQLQKTASRGGFGAVGALTAYGERLLDQYDPEYGGFGGAPKFPHVTDIRFLLRLAWRTGDRRWAEPAAHTLDRMIAGGLMDQIGGGFSRYSVDEFWLVPHFEKMLYDNGLLLLALAEADALLGVDPERRRARRGIVGWLERRMLLPGGGFAASLDADSEGEEGRYYLWTPEQLAELLDSAELELAVAAWGVEPGGNFEGRTILSRVDSRASDAALTKRFGPEWPERLARLAETLLTTRQERVKPGRDDKFLLGWNALMIRGLLRNAALGDDPRARPLAENALRFITETMRANGTTNGTNSDWFSVWRDGRRHTPAFLDDYAFLLDALLEAGDPWLELAVETAERMIERFADPDGGFFFTPTGQDDVIVRAKGHFDASIPSGNGAAATALIRLSLATGEGRYRESAARAVAAMRPHWESSPGGHGQLMLAADLLHHGGSEVTIATDAPQPFLAALGRRYLPDPIVTVRAHAGGLPGHLQGRLTQPGASLCAAGVCRPPQSDAIEWGITLDQQNRLA